MTLVQYPNRVNGEDCSAQHDTHKITADNTAQQLTHTHTLLSVLNAVTRNSSDDTDTHTRLSIMSQLNTDKINTAQHIMINTHIDDHACKIMYSSC